MRDPDEAKMQAWSFRAAAVGSAISNFTLGVANSVKADPALTSSSAHIPKSGIIQRLGLSSLRGYLRRRRLKRQAKQIDKLRQALLLAGFTSTQFEISERLSLIEKKLEQVFSALTASGQTDSTNSMLSAFERKLDSMVSQVGNFSTEADLIHAPFDASVSPNVIQLTDG